ncbi:ABC transporter ATP-binding protein [Brachybacterium vulturis]|uniref:ABC transporter ATP-binding protein n=1 Tax=Brachybacterium vulturis TaxID=2017484 RepID=A0A291GRI9_9MICO|nr:ABC transporter ATP-binding protein [Brachybacterium vulturis]ATG52855.1 ABC transporter ATP-binding protein [Brachybacterium vulturis]
MNAIETRTLSKHFRDVTALDGVSIDLAEGRVHGLLGRNGAGKTTLMKLLTGQLFATSGEMRVLGEDPVENAHVLSQTCFIQESQKYPDGFRPLDVLRIAGGLYPAWDQSLARELVAEFRLPEKRVIKKLSRGQLSAVGIIVGLASRAPLTFFDEPYLGLDAVARRLFFDRLLADFSEHPRTVILSTHHIDEVSNLLEHVVLLDEGRVAISAETEELQSATIEVSGRLEEVRSFAAGAEVLHLQEIGALATAAVHAEPGSAERARAAGLQVSPVSLQNYIVHRTTAAASAPVT